MISSQNQRMKRTTCWTWPLVWPIRASIYTPLGHPSHRDIVLTPYLIFNPINDQFLLSLSLSAIHKWKKVPTGVSGLYKAWIGWLDSHAPISDEEYVRGRYVFLIHLSLAPSFGPLRLLYVYVKEKGRGFAEHFETVAGNYESERELRDYPGWICHPFVVRASPCHPLQFKKRFCCLY